MAHPNDLVTTAGIVLLIVGALFPFWNIVHFGTLEPLHIYLSEMMTTFSDVSAHRSDDLFRRTKHLSVKLM